MLRSNLFTATDTCPVNGCGATRVIIRGQKRCPSCERLTQPGRTQVTDGEYDLGGINSQPVGSAY